MEAGRALGARLRELGLLHALRGIAGPARVIPEAAELDALAAVSAPPARALVELACLGRSVREQDALAALGADALGALVRAEMIATSDGRACMPEHALFASPHGWLVGDRPLGYPGVVPRPARAFVDDESLALAEHVARASVVPVAIDLGCGAGLTSQAAAVSATRVIAVDVQELAVAAARCGLAATGLDDRVEVRSGDLFAAARSGERFDRVVAFLPALPLPDDEIAPSHAGGDDGSALSARVVREAPAFLRDGGEVWLGAALLFGDGERVVRTRLVQALDACGAEVTYALGTAVGVEVVAAGAGALLGRGDDEVAERRRVAVRAAFSAVGARTLAPAVLCLRWPGPATRETVVPRGDLVQWRR